MRLRIGIGVGMIPQQARPVPTTEPVNTSAPFFPAPLTQGQTVAIDPGSWTGLPSGAYEYKRQRWNGSTWVDVGAFSSSPNVTFDASDVAAGANGVRPVVRATNVVGPTTANGTVATIAALPSISGTPGAPVVGTPYTFTPSSAGGHAPRTFALTGTLPAGLSFNTATGAITGTPTTSGTASGLNITVTDADGLTASLGAFSLVVTAGGRSGTSPTLYSVAGTRLRFPSQTGTIVDNGASTLTNHVNQVVFYSPDYEITDPRFLIPNFHQLTTGGEVVCPANIILDGLALRIDAGNWIRNDTGYPLTVTPSDSGKWTPALTCTIPANSKITLRWAWHVDTLSGNLAVPLVDSWKHVTITGTAATSDASRADTAANAATLLSTYLPANGATGNGSTLGNTGSSIWLPPAMMIAKGGDGRPAVLIMGDSIAFGTSATANMTNYTARGEWGYVPVGLDDNATSQRLAYCNLAVPGQGPTAWGSSKATYWAKKAAVTQAVYDAYGYWPFDYVLNQHGENSVPGLMTGTNPSTNLAQYYTNVRAQWPGLPVIQVELIPRVSSSDMYATTANQTPNADNLYPTGDRWRFNTAAAAGGSLRTGGYIDGSIQAWASVSADTGSDRDTWAVAGNVSTTLDSAYASPSNSVVTVASIPAGAGFKIAGVAGWFHVTGASGSGPYTLTVQRNAVSGSASAGAAVQEVPTGDDVHPTSRYHRDKLAPAIVGWKVAEGFV